MFPTRVTAVPRGRKKTVMAPSGCVRVVMTISIGVSAGVVPIFASVLVSSVLVSYGCPILVRMLIRALLALVISMFILSMFILTILRRKAEWGQADHRKCAEGK